MVIVSSFLESEGSIGIVGRKTYLLLFLKTYLSSCRFFLSWNCMPGLIYLLKLLLFERNGHFWNLCPYLQKPQPPLPQKFLPKTPAPAHHSQKSVNRTRIRLIIWTYRTQRLTHLVDGQGRNVQLLNRQAVESWRLG